LKYARTIVILAGLILLAALVAQSEVLKCAWCKKPITRGEYYQTDGLNYHRSCYWNNVAPRCEVCKKAIEGQHVVYEGKKYHDACYKSQVAFRCDYCDEIIVGAYLTTYWGDRYCQRHEGQVAECLYCGRLVGDRHNRGGKTYADGRHICSLCLQSVVNTQYEAERLLKEIQERLDGLGIRIDIDDVPLNLVDRKELGRNYGGDMTRNSAFCKKEFRKLFGKEVGQQYSIYVLDGMPRMHFIVAVAHELMHVWQYTYAPADNDPQLCEGSCNYAASMVLRQIGGKELQYQIVLMDKDSDSVYGDGYRRVKKLVEAKGVSDWLVHLKTDRGFAEGY
jgi:hypothetical protein